MTISSLLKSEGSIDVDHVINRFLDMFDCIRLVAPSDDQYNIGGRGFLASVVRTFVIAGEPISLVLPAFPAKSPNVTMKVLGSLPDRGEELAFGVLEHFCRDVERFYPPGAEVVIFSYGRVSSDLLGITSETVAMYEEECHRMVRDLGYTHIRFDDLQNHLVKGSGSTSTTQAELISMLLGASSVDVGASSVDVGASSVDVDALLASDAELRKLHRSTQCYLRLDLEPMKDVLLSQFPGGSQKLLKEFFKQKCRDVSKSMLLRNMAFSKLVGKAYPAMVRLSVHAHTNAGPKFGICLIPGHDRSITSHTPWHNCIVESSDGQVHIMKREKVDMTKYEMYEHPVYNRPWGFKEKTIIQKLMTTAEGVPQLMTAADVSLLASLPVEAKQLHPCGILVQCIASLTPLDIPSETIRRLIMQFGVVVLRGFQPDVESHGDKLVAIADQNGEIVYWTNFGAVLDVKELPGATGSVMSSHALPFHWDGNFKFYNSQLQEIPFAHTPSFVLFECVKAPAEGETGGETLLTDTRRLLRSNINAEKWELLNLASLEAEYFTPPSGYFGGRWVQHKLVSPHPITGEPRVRYLEPWPKSKSAKQWTVMRAVRESDAAAVAETSQLVRGMMYDEDLFCYRHSWMAKDLVFLDNHAVVHARTAFTHGSERYIRRIHFN